MEISQLSEMLRHNTVGVVFLNVFLQQIGLPVPAVPTLLLAGSLATSFGSLAYALAAAIVASLVADWAWYQAGRAMGYRALSFLCRLSINPASCVGQTEARFDRWGVSSLVVAKFIPGFSTVAPPIAGALQMRLPGFLVAAALGGALWAGLALGAGWMLRQEVQYAIGILNRQAGSLLMVAVTAFVAWLSWKLWKKYHFQRLSAMPHITPTELLQALASPQAPLVLDLRGKRMVAEAGPIDGARTAERDNLLAAVGDWPKGRPIVTICSCPDEASAVQAAHRLQREGYVSVRPLTGGFDAWMAAKRDEATNEDPVVFSPSP